MCITLMHCFLLKYPPPLHTHTPLHRRSLPDACQSLTSGPAVPLSHILKQQIYQTTKFFKQRKIDLVLSGRTGTKLNIFQLFVKIVIFYFLLLLKDGKNE